MRRKCTKCGARASSDATYCHKCGEPIVGTPPHYGIPTKTSGNRKNTTLIWVILGGIAAVCLLFGVVGLFYQKGDSGETRHRSENGEVAPALPQTGDFTYDLGFDAGYSYGYRVGTTHKRYEQRCDPEGNVNAALSKADEELRESLRPGAAPVFMNGVRSGFLLGYEEGYQGKPKRQGEPESLEGLSGQSESTEEFLGRMADFRLSEKQRRNIWREDVAAEDRARKKAGIVRVTTPGTTDNHAGRRMERRFSLADSLETHYKSKICSRYAITQQELRDIELEGLLRNWPLPPPESEAERSTPATPRLLSKANNCSDVPPPSTPSGNDSDVFLAFDEPPVLIDFVKPSYPDVAREAGFEGTVRVRVLVGEDGKVVAEDVLWSDVSPAMEQAALAAARKCRFTPAKHRTTPVKANVIIPFHFRLDS